MEQRIRVRVIIYANLFIALAGCISVILYPHLLKLSELEYQLQIQQWISRWRWAGMLLILVVQMIQVVIAFIPGEPVEVLAGILYGAGGGLLICLTGCVLASTIIFALSKRFGKELLYRLFSKRIVDNWAWLQDNRKSEVVTFILFLIPGTPKDMLTYFVGVTDMRLSKFIAISSVARIPSIITSTLIGTSVRYGEWELMVIIFIITGAVGITGICLRNKAIAFCRRSVRRSGERAKTCECLDLVAAAHSRQIYPLIHCRMEMEGPFDEERLKMAVDYSGRYVPEIFCTYDFDRNQFVSQDFTAEHVFISTSPGLDGSLNWELDKGPQLQIAVDNRGNDHTTVLIGVSHILTDGAGFLQYLYLLAWLYNQIPAGWNMVDDILAGSNLKNYRDLSLLLGDIHVGTRTEQTRMGQKVRFRPVRQDNRGTRFFCLNSTIAPADFLALRKKAKQSGVTLNHTFITAYARVLARTSGAETVVIPCPADLRRFRPLPDTLSVANMTGVYRIVIESVPQHTFDELLAQVSIEMMLQKQRYRCFAGIKPLYHAFGKLPGPLLKPIIRRSYPLSPVSYTNIGVIDHQKLSFDSCDLKRCYLTGSYRHAPDYQLSVSTFRNTCLLCCTIVGEDDELESCQSVLDQVQYELVRWAKA